MSNSKHKERNEDLNGVYETEITVKVKRAYHPGGFVIQAATFELNGEEYAVTSGAGCGNARIAVFAIDGDYFFVDTKDFVEAVLESKETKEPSP